MPMLEECGKENFNIINILKYLFFKIEQNRKNPTYFHADGLLCFVGAQGQGKTLSAVNYVCKLLGKYPNCKLVTNLYITDYPIIEFDEYCKLISFDSTMSMEEKKELYYKENRVFRFSDNEDFFRHQNGFEGVIFLIDEIQLYMNSLGSKNINMDVITEISQQRKQRKHIVCTSQVFGRMAKPLREQFSNVIVCKNYLGFVQLNKLIDRDSLDDDSSTGTNITGKVKRTFFWLHSPTMYSRYDTYYKIKKTKFVDGEKQVRKEELYGD